MPLRGKPALQNGDVKSPLQKESEVAKRDLSPARPGAQKLSLRIGLAASIGLTRWTRERTGKSGCATKSGHSMLCPYKKKMPAGSRRCKTSVGAGEVFVDNAPVFAMSGKNVGAAPVNFVAAAELNGPVKRGNGSSAIHGHVRLLDVVGELGRALQIVVKRFAEGGQQTNAFVLCGREAHEGAVKHLQRAPHVGGIDGAD